MSSVALKTLAMFFPEAERAETSSNTDNVCTYFIFGLKGVLAGIFCVSGIVGEMSTYGNLFYIRES